MTRMWGQSPRAGIMKSQAGVLSQFHFLILSLYLCYNVWICMCVIMCGYVCVLFRCCLWVFRTPVFPGHQRLLCFASIPIKMSASCPRTGSMWCDVVVMVMCLTQCAEMGRAGQFCVLASHSDTHVHVHPPM